MEYRLSRSARSWRARWSSAPAGGQGIATIF
jgi:hypothetical protein